MSRTLVTPVVLSGGSGTRLWPLSRDNKPKQFLDFGGQHSLIQQTILRCRGDIFAAKPIVVAAEAHRFLIAEALRDIGTSADILLEPLRRDSCAAVVVGVLQAFAQNSEAVVLVVAADHYIPDVKAFAGAVAAGVAAAEAGWLVTFGIQARSASTGYGYISAGESVAEGLVRKVKAFVEKPNATTAQSYVDQGYFWNSGNFLFKAKAFLDEAARLVPDVVKAAQKSLQLAVVDLDFLRLDAEGFAQSPQISVDFAIMEKTTRAAVLPVDYLWSDIGTWDSVAATLGQDDDGNAVVGRGVVADSRNVLVHAENRLTTVVGCEDLIVVSTRDAVMVAQKGHSEKVKTLVARLKDEKFWEADNSVRRYRPWGYQELLDDGEGYQVRRISIDAGQSISRQSHAKRAEHWIVVKGEAVATLNADEIALRVNQSLSIPAGSLHHLTNVGQAPLMLIEIQTGDDIDEDDVKRV